jgi:hypothetical protein
MAAGIGILNDLPAPPLGQGKVIIRFFVSTQSSGICVSRNLHPVARAISKDIGIHEGTPCTAKAFRAIWMSLSEKTGLMRAIGPRLIR